MKEIEFTIEPLKLGYHKGRSVGRRNYAGYSEKRKMNKLRQKAIDTLEIYEFKKTKSFVVCDFCGNGIMNKKEWEEDNSPAGFIEVIEKETDSCKNTILNFCNKECFNNWRETR